MLNHLTKFQDSFSTIKVSTILSKGVYGFNIHVALETKMFSLVKNNSSFTLQSNLVLKTTA